MTAFYSFDVWCERDEVPIPEMHVVLERGQNGFNGLVENIDEFVEKLTEQGVRFLKPPFQLDLHEPLDRVALLDGLHEVDEPAVPEPSILVPGVSSNPFLVSTSGASSSPRGSVVVPGIEPEGDGSAPDRLGGTEADSLSREE